MTRESEMIVIERNADGVPTVWCDPEIVDLVTALNAGGLPTVWSCSGHGEKFGMIGLRDGRQLMILPDLESAHRVHEQIAKKPEERVVVGQASACTFVGGTKGAEVTFHVTTPASEQGEGA